MNRFKTFIKDDEGQDMVEYALLAALITVVAIGAIQLVGDQVISVFQSIQDALSQ